MTSNLISVQNLLEHLQVVIITINGVVINSTNKQIGVLSDYDEMGGFTYVHHGLEKDLKVSNVTLHVIIRYVNSKLQI